MTLKYLPELHFELDRTLEQAARIDALLDDLDPTASAESAEDATAREEAAEEEE